MHMLLPFSFGRTVKSGNFGLIRRIAPYQPKISELIFPPLGAGKSLR